MTVSAAKRRAALVFLLAVMALAGAIWSAQHVRSIVDVAPIIAGGRTTTSTVYDPPMLVLTLFLVTVSAVLVIVAVASWRRIARSPLIVPAAAFG